MIAADLSLWVGHPLVADYREASLRVVGFIRGDIYAPRRHSFRSAHDGEKEISKNDRLMGVG
jgi:hypothetical protein